jgi:hypothetical protein
LPLSGCGKDFAEPAIDGRQQIAGFGAAPLVAAQPGKAHRAAQFPELGFLLLSRRHRCGDPLDLDGAEIDALRRRSVSFSVRSKTAPD